VLGHEPRDLDVAAELGISPATYYRYRAELNSKLR
jgi:hypothetical protein